MVATLKTHRYSGRRWRQIRSHSQVKMMTMTALARTGGSVSMAAVGATIGVLIVVSVLLYQLLAWLSVRYNAAIGRKMKRPQAAWLKPMSGERRTVEVKQPLTAVEKIVMISVVVAVEAFLVWFFFLAHYSLPG